MNKNGAYGIPPFGSIGVFALFYAAVILTYVNVGNNFILLAVLFTIQIIGMCSSFIIMPYRAEFFPMRNTASGALNAFGRLGAFMVTCSIISA